MAMIILASESPRRSELLKSLGWNFKVIAPNITEKKQINETPIELACRLADEKAQSVYKLHEENCVIAADTLVTINGKIFGKPNDKNEAKEMLSELQGKRHKVITGVALYVPGAGNLVSAEETAVSFRKLTSNEIDSYLKQNEYKDKAGAYAIQGKGILLVESIVGCYFNVVGLPVQLLSKMFDELGWSLANQWEAGV